tara:strand:- start:3 stop:140 length:138 start_codon:yes stop_codon:yes gene_type:complete
VLLWTVPVVLPVIAAPACEQVTLLSVHPIVTVRLLEVEAAVVMRA